MWFKRSVKNYCVAKVLLATWETFLHENNCTYNSYRFSYKFAFILFSPFLTNQKQESGFQQVGGLVTRNISVFSLKRVALYLKVMPNSMDFYEGSLPCYFCLYYSFMLQVMLGHFLLVVDRVRLLDVFVSIFSQAISLAFFIYIDIFR